MVGQNQKKDTTEYDLDHLVQSSFNYGDDQFLEKMQKAEETVDDDQIPPEPEDGFERLMAKMSERGITAYSESDEDGESRRTASMEETEKPRKIRGLHAIIRVAIAAAIIGSVFAMTSVSVGAKKSYKYEVKSQDGRSNKVVINNKVDRSSSDSLENAYTEIHDELGVRVLRIGNIPKSMTYFKTVISSSKATMYFNINNHTFSFVQQMKTTENSTNISSDCEIETTVYNIWLEQDVVINKSNNKDGETEYGAAIVAGNGYYYLASTVDKDTFMNIVEDLNFIE